MNKTFLITTSAAAMFALSGAAFAQSSATATVDLNIRSGPGPSHQVVGVIQADDSVTVDGCLEGSRWCRISYDGREGWVYSEYLTADFQGQRVVISERREAVGVPIVTHDGGGVTGSTVGMAGGALAGALIAGPIGAVVGGVAGAATGGITGSVIDPPSNVRTYVQSNRFDPVYLDGEVVIGAGLPDTVELRTIPDYEYHYVYVNEVPVLVEPGSRRIVYVLR
ncbi:MAG: DUF1236 domain-containing protein [Salinarimonadaceae bacterium]|nr:MAG: DUF1236 domain-containing protein [Salinarimonadaceae bacterium]